jgi:hypothetical protein
MSLHDASKDLRYLLNRGYGKSSAVTFVCNHYQLTRKDRHFLVRSIFSDTHVKTACEKKLPLHKIRGEPLTVDGFNVLITTDAVLKNEAFLCDDSVVRDALGIFGKYKITEATYTALDAIYEVINECHPKEVTFYFDQQVSHSGKLCKSVRDHFSCTTAAHVDLLLAHLNKITATSDSILIEKLTHFVDIPFEILLSKNL